MIHLIVGNTGSGKTTYATSLKKKVGGLLFSIDTWNNTLFLKDKTSNDGLPWMLERIDRGEKMMMNLIEQLEAIHVDSILDLGLSKFEHREKFRSFARQNNFKTKMHFLDIDKDIRWERIQHRNNTKGATFEFEVTLENFEFMEEWFEKPDELEMQNGLTIQTN